MKTRHFLSSVTLAIAFATLGIAPLAQAQTKEPVKASLRLKWLAQTQFAGFYYAQAKGYYKDEGIDLTINPGGPNLLTENLVATGADTFGLSGGTDSVLAGVDKGLPIVSIGVAHQITPFVFVTRKDGPVRSLKDFEGRKVTTWFTGANGCCAPISAMRRGASACRFKAGAPPRRSIAGSSDRRPRLCRSAWSAPCWRAGSHARS